MAVATLVVQDVRALFNIEGVGSFAQDGIQLSLVRRASSLAEKWATTRLDWRSAMMRLRLKFHAVAGPRESGRQTVPGGVGLFPA